jgi:DNA-binding transcriptional LysR family regulator
VREGFDLSLRVGEPSDGALIGRLLSIDRMVACANPPTVASHGMPEAPEDLAVHQVISPTAICLIRILGSSCSRARPHRPRSPAG